MRGFPLILADANRAEEFLLLGRSHRLFAGFSTYTDADGVVWAVKAAGGHVFAVTWLGAGWAFDPAGRERRAEELQKKREAMIGAGADRNRQELETVVAGLRLGTMAERLLWVIHQQVLRLRSSLIRLPDYLLADAIWAAEGQRPSHWRTEILSVLRDLTWLHIAELLETEDIAWGGDTVLITHAADLRGSPQDSCTDACQGGEGPRHHHYLINVGRGFLGVVEQFAQDEDATGIRSYAFPVTGRFRKQSATLRKVGKSGELVSIYLPAKLGRPMACNALTIAQHRLLQAIVRETTRNTKEERQSASEAEVLMGNSVPTYNGRGTFACDRLDPQGTFVGFNGNKVLKGRGYRLATDGGWLAKAGYYTDQIGAFFDDLASLSEKLGLIPVGIQPDSQQCLDLPQMRGLTGSPGVNRLHLRIYASSEYIADWNRVFGWDDAIAPSDVATDPVVSVTTAMQARSISQRQLAVGMDVDPSLLSKVLRGKRPWPQRWLDRARTWLNSQPSPESQQLP